MGDKSPKSQQKAKKQDASRKTAEKAEHDRKQAPPTAPAGKKGK